MRQFMLSERVREGEGGRSTAAAAAGSSAGGVAGLGSERQSTAGTHGTSNGRFVSAGRGGRVPTRRGDLPLGPGVDGSDPRDVGGGRDTRPTTAESAGGGGGDGGMRFPMDGGDAGAGDGGAGFFAPGTADTGGGGHGLPAGIDAAAFMASISAELERVLPQLGGAGGGAGGMDFMRLGLGLGLGLGMRQATASAAGGSGGGGGAGLGGTFGSSGPLPAVGSPHRPAPSAGRDSSSVGGQSGAFGDTAPRVGTAQSVSFAPHTEFARGGGAGACARHDWVARVCYGPHHRSLARVRVCSPGQQWTPITRTMLFAPSCCRVV